MSTTVEPSSEQSAPLEAIRQSQGASVSPQPSAPRRGKGAKAWTAFMKLVRRVHLYSGIFMFPFVLLYGFSGWFFNHPRYFTGDQLTTFRGDAVADGRLATLAVPEEMARAVVEQLNVESAAVDGPTVTLTDERSPQYSSFLTFSADADRASHQISIDPLTGHGEIRTTFADDDGESSDDGPPRNPLSMISRAEIADNALAEAQQAIPALLEELDLPSAEASAGRRAASLTFSVDVDDVPTLVSYNLGSGGVSAVREDYQAELPMKSFLQRMHMARMYSPHWNTKWFWALQVDAMFVSMVFWGASGMLMWWQIRRTRLLGSLFFAASVISAALLMMGMHEKMTRPIRSRGGQAAVQAPQPQIAESVVTNTR